MRETPALSRLLSLAFRQHGYVTHRQILALGWSRDWIEYRVKVGWLTPVHKGVYAVGAVPYSPIALAHAAVLACGEQAVLSHASAAALWGMLKRWPAQAEITAPKEKRRSGITTHRSVTLTGVDVRRHSNMRVTSPARTIVDIERRLTDHRLVRAVNDARLNGHLGPAELNRLLARCPRAAALIDPSENPTRSGFEDAFRRFAAKYDLPIPRFNRSVNGHEVDAYYPDQKVIIELDSWRYHQDRRTFNRDRDKDADHAAADHVSIRVTEDRLTQHEADRIRRTLTIRS